MENINFEYNYSNFKENIIKEEVLLISDNIEEIFGRRIIDLKVIKDNVVIIEFEGSKGSKIIAKRSINKHPLLNYNNKMFEYFYINILNNSDLKIPKYFGKINEIDLFSYIDTNDQLLSDTEICKTLILFHEFSKKTMFLNYKVFPDYSNKSVISYLNYNLDKFYSLNSCSKLNDSFKKVINNIEQLLEYLKGLPSVLVHGDFWDENFINSFDGLYTIDWENIHINNIFYDITTFFYSAIFIKNRRCNIKPFIEYITKKNNIKNFEKPMDANFLWLTLSQILPACNENLKNNKDFKWKHYWLNRFEDMSNKYFK